MDKRTIINEIRTEFFAAFKGSDHTAGSSGEKARISSGLEARTVYFALSTSLRLLPSPS